MFLSSTRSESRRQDGAPLTRHPVLTLCAVIGDMDDWEAIEEWGNARLDWLRQFVPLENGIPSHDTLGCVFAAGDLSACAPSGATGLNNPIALAFSGSSAFILNQSAPKLPTSTGIQYGFCAQRAKKGKKREIQMNLTLKNQDVAPQIIGFSIRHRRWSERILPFWRVGKK